MAKIVPLKASRRSSESDPVRVVGMRGGGTLSRKVVLKSAGSVHELRPEGVKRSAVSTDRDARYKRRAQVLLYQAASLLAEVEGSEQRLAWLLEDCADLLVREEQMGPVA